MNNLGSKRFSLLAYISLSICLAVTITSLSSIALGYTKASSLTWSFPFLKLVKSAEEGSISATDNLPLKEMGKSVYAGNAALLLAALRELQGELSKEEEEALNSRFAPYFFYPSEESERALAELVTVTHELLNLRGMVATAAIELQDSLNEAVTAAVYGSEEGVKEAIAIAELQKMILEGFKAKVEELSKKVSEKKDLPDPLKELKGKKKEWRELLRFSRGLSPALEVSASEGVRPKETLSRGVWRLYNSIIASWPRHGGSGDPRKIKAEVNFASQRIEGEMIMPRTRLYQRLVLKNHDGLISILLRDSRFENLKLDNKVAGSQVVTIDEGYLMMLEMESLLYLPGTNDVIQIGNRGIPPVRGELRFKYAFDVYRRYELQKLRESLGYPPGKVFFKTTMPGVMILSDTFLPIHTVNLPKDLSVLNNLTIDDKTYLISAAGPYALHLEKLHLLGFATLVNVDPRKSPGIAWGTSIPFQEGKVPVRIVPGKERGQIARLIIAIDIDPTADPNWKSWFQRKVFLILEYVWDPDPTYSLSSKWLEESQERAHGVPEEADGGDLEEDSDDLRETIEFHKRNVEIIKRNIDRTREELSREKDPERRAQLELLLLHQQSDLVMEEDLIESLRTGKHVHRRTPFEDYARDRFIQSIREEQAKLEHFQRACSSLYRMASLLPEDEAKNIRSFIQRQLTPQAIAKLDIDLVRKLAGIVNEKVQGYLESEKAKAQMDEAIASYALETAESLKKAAEGAMFVCSIFGGKGINFAYQATTGYVEGGAQEAMLRAASWFSIPTYVAAEVIRAYKEEASSKGVIEAAIKAYVFSKAFEKMSSYVKGFVTQKAPASKATPKEIGDIVDLRDFEKRVRAGIIKAKEFTQLTYVLKKAGEAGASAETIAKLQEQIKKAAAAVSADYHAKIYLKYKGDLYAQKAYNANMRAVHAEVEAKFHEKMAQKGWERVKLREFRNASSWDSVGMDYDIGIDKETANRLIKNGKRASPFEWQRDAQKAWDEAYKEVTGTSASRAWETVTTPFHAEAYRDLAWLSLDKSKIKKAWAQQAADVTRYKAWRVLNDPNLDKITALQEVSRGTAKDVKTKLLPLLDLAIKRASPESVKKMELYKGRWEEVQKVLEDFGKNDLDPIEASRKIRAITGRDIPQVVEDVASTLEFLGKAVGK